MPAVALSRAGARVVEVPSADGMTIDTDRLLAAIDEETLLVPISHVLFKSGYLQDAQAVIDKAHAVGAYVVLKAFAGFRDCAAQPDAWHQYSAALPEYELLPDSFMIAPGFDERTEIRMRGYRISLLARRSAWKKTFVSSTVSLANNSARRAPRSRVILYPMALQDARVDAVSVSATTQAPMQQLMNSLMVVCHQDGLVQSDQFLEQPQAVNGDGRLLTFFVVKIFEEPPVVRHLSPSFIPALR